jgi:ABC-type phosphate/phosphonate transport system permease subunit
LDKSAARVTIFITILFAAAVFFAAFYPADVLAGDPGETGELQHKVDLDNQTGINLIIARLYNDNRLLFALAVTATMAIMGVIIGQITGFILRILGLK